MTIFTVSIYNFVLSSPISFSKIDVKINKEVYIEIDRESFINFAKLSSHVHFF